MVASGWLAHEHDGRSPDGADNADDVRVVQRLHRRDLELEALEVALRADARGQLERHFGRRAVGVRLEGHRQRRPASCSANA